VRDDNLVGQPWFPYAWVAGTLVSFGCDARVFGERLQRWEDERHKLPGPLTARCY
jgi:hypothetical protein